LRKKLAVAGVPNLIDTVWGCGYILREPQITIEPANTTSQTPTTAATSSTAGAFSSHSQAAA
jgi:DNA-binding winged helix-turn-helix (wHTH) protein